MTDAAHEPWSDELAAYAVDALGPDERREVEAHLAGCERCRTELRWLEPAVDVLAESVTQLTPPPRLRERLLDATAADAPAGQGGGERTGLRRLWPSWATRPVAALAATALLAAGIAGYALRGGDAPSPPPAPQMALDREGDSGTLRVSNLPEPEEGVYQVWIQHGDEVSASSAFVTDAEGDAQTRIPSDLRGADAVMVTHELERGRQTPSGEPLMQSDLD
jgi:anti-sigma-K factor RskA